MRAIVIDDSRAMRVILRRLLEGHGFGEVLEAENGQVALDVLAQQETAPNLALVDWNMPVMDGLQFIMTARKTPALREMTLMMVTTESEQEQIVRALASGAHEYVIKPFNAEGIGEKLALLGLVPIGVAS
ncbi:MULTISPECIES: response regulator [Actinosynnema]|uniref:Response regulator receiver protein n=3 Tax=Actinosynnema TaxID=40566 RepID=C6WJN4_ACTMD|nr:MULTISPECIES: response regulator [Actinosynnema]ACU36259.1 response regulator receiver protein [Actinosynnema mirum DSM 43827]ATE53894.1 response regulator [Actinosynnema pretiosum]